MEIVALIASIVSIVLAFFAIWQANHHRDQSDKLNRDTTEKLARIEAFATSTKEDAFKELERWGDFARAGGKASEEAEKAKEEEMKKLKDEIQASTSAEISKVLQTVESKLSSTTETSTISEIKTQFEELKKEIGRIQAKGLGKVKRLESEEKFKASWLSFPIEKRELLVKLFKGSDHLRVSEDELAKYGIHGIMGVLQLADFFRPLFSSKFVVGVGNNLDGTYDIILSRKLVEFLKGVKGNEME